MEIQTILMTVIIFILLYIVVRYVMKSSAVLTTLTSATTQQTVPAASLDAVLGTTSTNFSYSIWFYLDDWNYQYGSEKILFARQSSATGKAATSTSLGSGGEIDNGDITSIINFPCPAVSFDATQNNIVVSVTCQGTDTIPAVAATATTAAVAARTSNPIVYNCTVTNFPIQSWVNLLVSVYGLSLDIYLNGKLVKTCVLPNVPLIDSTQPVQITPNNGFSGWTATFQYFTSAINPQEAWNIYQEGYGSSWLSSLINQYSIKLALLVDGNERSSISI